MTLLQEEQKFYNELICAKFKLKNLQKFETTYSEIFNNLILRFSNYKNECYWELITKLNRLMASVLKKIADLNYKDRVVDDPFYDLLLDFYLLQCRLLISTKEFLTWVFQADPKKTIKKSTVFKWFFLALIKSLFFKVLLRYLKLLTYSVCCITFITVFTSPKFWNFIFFKNKDFKNSIFWRLFISVVLILSGNLNPNFLEDNRTNYLLFLKASITQINKITKTFIYKVSILPIKMMYFIYDFVTRKSVLFSHNDNLKIVPAKLKIYKLENTSEKLTWEKESLLINNLKIDPFIKLSHSINTIKSNNIW